MASEQPAAVTTADQPPAVVRKAIAASAIGNATEWFDYGIYAYGVTYISAAIFTGEAATQLALATFAISFLVRPLGGLVWGPLGDRIGRKRVLALTILMMAGATLCVGALGARPGFVEPLLSFEAETVTGMSSGARFTTKRTRATGSTAR